MEGRCHTSYDQYFLSQEQIDLTKVPVTVGQNEGTQKERDQRRQPRCRNWRHNQAIGVLPRGIKGYLPPVDDYSERHDQSKFPDAVHNLI
jgi:hypothetical protein